ncbi:pyrimidodiazepine synthase-like [Culicoides brevitarsis]|uniref:pyrimidodiazepine synthase-like n=1 Tax=Culicoides brevitarsis TaxID=469753 RepID=UPI00307BAAFE
MEDFKHLTQGSPMPSNSSNQLVLYSCVICPFAQRVHLALNAKQIPYSAIYIDLWKKPEWYVQKSPTTKVPALAIPEQTDPLIESLIIADYLDEKFPENPLHSRNALEKANDRVLIERFSNVIGIVAKIMYPMMRNFQKIEDVENVAEDLFKALDVFEHELREKRKSLYFGGEKAGMVDFMIWPWMERSLFLPKIDGNYELKSDRFPLLIKWRNLMLEHPAVKACVLSTDFFFEFYQKLEAKESINDLIDEASKKRETERNNF